MDHPVRKHPRLKDYDYSQNGAYFVTICTKDKEVFFPICRDDEKPRYVASDIAVQWLQELPKHFQGLRLERYVLMPNHVHILLRLEEAQADLKTVIQWYKTMTTNAYIKGVKAGKVRPFSGQLWQSSFHEHVIRDENDFLSRWQYIENNPDRWKEDMYYI